MKPILLQFKAFGSYLEEQTIDFSLLEKSGLFLISGETGSGKTTILDAICCALYGEASNKSRGDLETMRCKQAEKTDETRVEFVFETGARRYKFVRTLRYGHKNILDEHNCMEYRDGVYVPLFENPKKTRVNDKARELIGLTAEQFRQVIVLPQGKFETLLVSDSKEKEEILTSIFHVDRWDRIEQYLSEEVKKEREALERQKYAMQQTLASYACENAAELSALLKQKRDEAQEMQTHAEALGKQQEEAAAQLQASLVDSDAFDRLDAAGRRQQSLSEKRGDMQALRDALELANRAQKARAPYDALSDAKHALEKAKKDASEAHDAREKAVRQAAATAEKRRLHDSGKEEYREQTTRLQKLREAGAAYDDVTKKAEEVKRARRLTESAEKTCAELKAQEAMAQENLRRCTDALNAADEQCRLARERYMCSVSGNLAQTALEEGKPCPVCGSVHHPHPAKPPQDGLTKQELDDVEAAREARWKAYQTAREQAEQAQANAVEAKDAQTQAELALQQALSDERHARSLLIEGVDTAEQLAEGTARLQTKINLYEQQEQALGDAQRKAEAEVTAKEQLFARAEEAVQTAEEALSCAAAAWETARAEAGFADTDAFLAAVREPRQMQQDAQDLAEYDASCTTVKQLIGECEEKVRGKTRPDVRALEERSKTLTSAWNEACGKAAVLQQTCGKMQKDCEALLTKETEYAARQLQLEENTAFQKRIAGSNGMSLKRYVLGVMLASVTEQANEMLRGIYGGRYSLYRTDASTGGVRRSGLELEVLDRQGNVRRSVKTLSGGEKFLAALSLAIGLSTVVQSQSGGVRLDAMFIDEGFGTLDRGTMQDALDVLHSVQKQSAIVGIISHVDALRESIPAQIEIVKGENGSRCRIRGV